MRFGTTQLLQSRGRITSVSGICHRGRVQARNNGLSLRRPRWRDLNYLFGLGFDLCAQCLPAAHANTCTCAAHCSSVLLVSFAGSAYSPSCHPLGELKPHQHQSDLLPIELRVECCSPVRGNWQSAIPIQLVMHVLGPCAWRDLHRSIRGRTDFGDQVVGVRGPDLLDD